MTSRIGVEISATSVRMIEIASDGDRRAKVLAFGEAPLQAGAMVDGVVVDRVAVLSAISSCVDNARLKPRSFGAKRPVWVAIAGLRAISREIQMPRVPESDLDAAVRLQALDIIPFAEEETLLSARSLGMVPAPDGSLWTRVHLAAAHRSLVDPVVDVLTAAGFEVVGVDLASSALVRSFASPARAELTPGVEAIVSIGADLTTIVVHENGESHFIRTIAGGGNSVTRAIAGALDVPFADAEALKIRIGRTAAAHAGRIPPEALAAARDGSAPLLAEIRSSLEYFASLPGLSEVSRVVVTGGGSQLEGFVDRLRYQSRVPVTVGSWLDRFDAGRLKVDLTHLETVGAVAAGAALAEPSGRKPFDLLPPEILIERKQVRATHLIESAALVLVVAFAGLGALRFLQVRTAQKGVATLASAIAAVQREIPRYNKVQQQDDAIFADSAIGLPLVSHEVYWPSVFRALSKYTPSFVSASGFSGTASVAPSATTTAATAAPSGASSALPAAGDTLGTVSLSFTGPQYPAFKRWFDATVASKRFEIVTFSGVTSSGSQVSFSAQLAITGLIHTDRLFQFEVPKR